jgi:hypothetical protein
MIKTLVNSPYGYQCGGAGRISSYRGYHRLARPARVVCIVEPEAVSSVHSLARAFLLFLDHLLCLLQCSSFVFGDDCLPCSASAPRLTSSSFETCQSYVCGHDFGAVNILFTFTLPLPLRVANFFHCFCAVLEFLAECYMHWPVYIMAAKLSVSHLLLYISSFTTIQHFVLSWFCSLPSSL